jgi:hypothetical protein
MLDNEEEDDEAVEGTVGIDPWELTLSCMTDRSLKDIGSSGILSKKWTKREDERPTIEDDLFKIPPSGDLLSD